MNGFSEHFEDDLVTDEKGMTVSGDLSDMPPHVTEILPKRYAVIEDGVVANVVMAFVPRDGWQQSDTAQIGDTWDGAEFAAHPTDADVNAERDRRLTQPFTFNGTQFGFGPESKTRISGAATLAGFALGAGAQPGDLLWHGGDTPFSWIADDNTLVTMDAPTAFAFGQAAANHESRIIFAARMLKDAPGGIPEDFADDQYWP